MAMNEALGKEVPVAGTYAHVEANPQGLISVLMAPIAGLYDPDSGQARAIDVALFILIIGGFLGIVTKTGAIDAGIERVTTRLRGREEWMIPILMALFAAGGTIYGMAEESLPFYTLLVPVMLAARFDPVVAASTVLLGAGIGTLGSTINPFATVIAANAAGIPFTNGITLRVVVLVIGWIICVTWVMRYARKVRKEPSLSIIADKQEENLAHFLGNKSEQALEFTGTQNYSGDFRPYLRGHDLRRGGAGLVDGGDLNGISGQRNYHRSDRPHERRGTDLYLYQRRARFAGRCTDYRYRARYRSDHG